MSGHRTLLSGHPAAQATSSDDPDTEEGLASLHQAPAERPADTGGNWRPVDLKRCAPGALTPLALVYQLGMGVGATAVRTWQLSREGRGQQVTPRSLPPDSVSTTRHEAWLVFLR